jgi:inner membrane protein
VPVLTIQFELGRNNMLIFGHTGFTLGVAALAARAVAGRKEGREEKRSFFSPLARYVDIRVLLVGSLLPDIIDKPIGEFFFRSTFHNGRIFAHTLLFLVLIAAAGYYLYRRRGHTWLITLAAGDFMHLALDEMWQVPGTFFWPLLGLHFPRYELADWFGTLLQGLLSEPYIYVSETIGLAVVIWFGAWLIARGKVREFIRHGRLY